MAYFSKSVQSNHFNTTGCILLETVGHTSKLKSNLLNIINCAMDWESYVFKLV